MKAMYPTRHELTCGLTHGIGAVLALIGSILLIYFAAANQQPWHVAAFSVFGASLVLLYAASTVYHLLPPSWRGKHLLRRLDHAMIYVLIAGTYTPICLVPLRGVWGWSVLAGVWVLAAAGVVVKLLWVRLPGWLSTATYVGLGWLSVLLAPLLLERLPGAALTWIVAGGLFYTVGALFYGLEKVLPQTRWNGMHEAFHLFVLAGSFSHFWVMWRYVMHLA